MVLPAAIPTATVVRDGGAMDAMRRSGDRGGSGSGIAVGSAGLHDSPGRSLGRHRRYRRQSRGQLVYLGGEGWVLGEDAESRAEEVEMPLNTEVDAGKARNGGGIGGERGGNGGGGGRARSGSIRFGNDTGIEHCRGNETETEDEDTDWECGDMGGEWEKARAAAVETRLVKELAWRPFCTRQTVHVMR